MKTTLTLAFLFSALANTSDAAVELDCSLFGTIKSQNSEVATNIEFQSFGENDEDQYKVYWLDYDGEPVEHAYMFPGDTLAVPTYMTHPWMVAAPQPGGPEICISIYVPVETPSIIQLK